MVSQGGFGAGTSGVGVRQIYETLFGAKGSTVNPDLALFPLGKPPTKLPRILPATKPKPSILNPGTPKVTVSASPTPISTAKAKAKR